MNLGAAYPNALVAAIKHSLRSPQPEPVPEDIRYSEAALPSGLINVVWDGRAFSVFYEDLKTSERS